MSDTLYKRCKCRGDDGKDLGASCPKLRRADGSWNPKHGTWYFALELPRGPGGKRRPRMRRGGFEGREDAEAARDKAKATLRKGADPSLRVTMEKYLTDWLASRVDLRPTARRNYTISVNTYLIPLLGHLQLGQLQAEDVAGAFATIREWNALLAAGKPVRKYQRHVGPAAMQRIRAVLRVALNDAMTDRKLDYNPAAGIRMESEGRRKPTEWTPERTRKFWADYRDALEKEPGSRGDRAFLTWRRLGLRPAKVMVWSAVQVGKFLDYAASSGARLLPMFELVHATGLRRGEVCGLHWTEVDFSVPEVQIVRERLQLGWDVLEEETTKSEAGDRRINFDSRTLLALQAWQLQQEQEREDWEGDWKGEGHVFTRGDGSPWHPDTVTDTFERLAFKAGLPPVKFHALRHGHANYALLAGVDIKIVQERLGHSSSKLTRDTYTTVLEDAARAVPEVIAEVVPRESRR